MSFGFDPELFIMDKKARTRATSIHLVTSNDKLSNLAAIDDSGWSLNDDASCVYGKTDGFAFELNSIPFTCRDQFIPLVGALLKDWYKVYGESWKLSAIPVMELNAKSRSGKPPLGVNEFGCLPDMNAYTMEEKTPFRDDYHNAHRYIGGHLHHSLLFQQTRWNDKDRCVEDIIVPDDERLVIAGAATIKMDLTVGLPLVAMLGVINDFGEAKRREYYGQAGSFRVKDYGVEYRVPSGAIMLSPALLAWSIGASREVVTHLDFQNAVAAAASVRKLKKAYDLEEIQNIINTHDVKAANKFLDDNKQLQLFERRFVNMLRRADELEVGFNTNFFKSWALDKKIVNHNYIGNTTALSSLTGGFLTADTKSVFTNESFPFLTVKDKLADVVRRDEKLSW